MTANIFPVTPEKEENTIRNATNLLPRPQKEFAVKQKLVFFKQFLAFFLSTLHNVLLFKTFGKDALVNDDDVTGSLMIEKM